MDAFLHLAESSTIRPISVIKPFVFQQTRLFTPSQASNTEWVAVFEDGGKMRFGTKHDNRKQRFLANLVERYGAERVAEFSRKYPLEFAV